MFFPFVPLTLLTFGISLVVTMTRYSTLSFLLIARWGCNKIAPRPYAALFVLGSTGERFHFIATLFLLTVWFAFLKKKKSLANPWSSPRRGQLLRDGSSDTGAVWGEKTPFSPEGPGLERCLIYQNQPNGDTQLRFTFKVVFSGTERSRFPSPCSETGRTLQHPRSCRAPWAQRRGKALPSHQELPAQPQPASALKSHHNLCIFLRSLFSRTSVCQLWSLT